MSVNFRGETLYVDIHQIAGGEIQPLDDIEEVRGVPHPNPVVGLGEILRGLGRPNKLDHLAGSAGEG
jgi:hypothetical protein